MKIIAPQFTRKVDKVEIRSGRTLFKITRFVGQIGEDLNPLIAQNHSPWVNDIISGHLLKITRGALEGF